jgi:hypothetical protein
MQIVRIRLYNVRGVSVSTVFDNSVNAGFHSLTLGGQPVSAGKYFVKIQTKGFEKTLPVLMVR